MNRGVAANSGLWGRGCVQIGAVQFSSNQDWSSSSQDLFCIVSTKAV